jgi:hypothetical protein
MGLSTIEEHRMKNKVEAVTEVHLKGTKHAVYVILKIAVKGNLYHW